MTTALTIQIPDDMMERFRAMAEREFRTPEGQALWLIKVTLEAEERRHSVQPSIPRGQAVSYEERIRAAQPVFAELRRAHSLGGAPSSRVIAKNVSQQTGTKISHTSVNGVLNGTIAPSWSVLERIVKVLGGDIEHFRQLWAESRELAGASGQ